MIKSAYGIVIILLLMGVRTYLQEGLSMRSVSHFLHSDMIQMVPLVGWYIAVVHLLFVGATAVNIAGTVCYGLLFAAVLTAAWHMKCNGAFYEDAIKFANFGRYAGEAVLESR